MENLGDPDLPLEDEVEHTVVSHTEAVQGRVIVPPYQANVGAGSGLDRILLEHAKLFLDAFREGTRNSSELALRSLGDQNRVISRHSDLRQREV